MYKFDPVTRVTQLLKSYRIEDSVDTPGKTALTCLQYGFFILGSRYPYTLHARPDFDLRELEKMASNIGGNYDVVYSDWRGANSMIAASTSETFEENTPVTKIVIFSNIVSFIQGLIEPTATHTIKGPVSCLASLNVLEWE